MKKVLPILLSIVVIISVFATVVFSSSATDSSPTYYVSGDYTYFVLGSTDAVIAGYGGADAEITIPETLDKYKVTAIDDFAFMANETLTSVTLPSTIVRVGEYAFLESSLSYVTIMNAECEIFDSEYTIPQSTVIRGYDNSTAQEYATKYERVFETLGDVPVIPTQALPTEATQPTQQLPSETVTPTEVVTPSETQTATEVVPTEATAPTQPEFILGDVDGDGDVSIIDATAIQLHVASIMLIDDDKISAGDADRDGDISIMDATQIQLFVAQLVDSL